MKLSTMFVMLSLVAVGPTRIGDRAEPTDTASDAVPVTAVQRRHSGNSVRIPVGLRVPVRTSSSLQLEIQGEDQSERGRLNCTAVSPDGQSIQLIRSHTHEEPEPAEDGSMWTPLWQLIVPSGSVHIACVDGKPSGAGTAGAFVRLVVLGPVLSA
ncbi:hypothetical protein [Mycobacteroides immunogenum]|uniref:Uncharacterized protein n=2 Tax=Mycobacteroides immunogenum TaxID=83262 RepID=A0A7V8LJ48_9MYCO|nr:hypothetical protein [Mycobacteroides immunogenum]KPG02422.1 hypothetical protein AN908_27835 [Mycobacteroides immunogenum]KPG18327.1 hypothetical protein AN911_27970 [Mycobacteroides immunogenum]KPG28281.1 hypothetical protein AN914_27975 [Mycobacteroides immunogenum]KPG42418.1 hypothetical protein AN916_27775 [Mycobacteroides immunogenum]